LRSYTASDMWLVIRRFCGTGGEVVNHFFTSLILRRVEKW
jgi:hypothetical protein